MDPRERYDDWMELLHVFIERHLSTLQTAFPVVVTEDSDGNNVTLQPTIKAKQTQRDGTTKDVEIPPLGTVPIQFAAGGGFTITHPIKKGDEGVAVYSSRAIDTWWKKGGLQPQAEQRRHHLSDPIYIPGVRNRPRQLGGNPDDQQQQASSNKGKPPSTTTLQIRSDDGSWYIEVAPNNVVNIVCKNMTITATEKVYIDSPLVECTGDLKVHGEVTAKSEGNSVTLSQHLTTQVQPGSGTSGPPEGGT
jgi:hypothetical protein